MDKPRVLVGDDQFGVIGSLMNESFTYDYKSIAYFDFADKPDMFIGMAKSGNYDALMIDLKWEEEDAVRENKTGYMVLDAVRGYAMKRILWTSESKEARDIGYQHGATQCIPKGMPPEDLEKILTGKV